MQRKLFFMLSIVIALLILLPFHVLADGDEILAPPSIEIAPGSGVSAGTGLNTLPGIIMVDVPGAVNQALLYWIAADFGNAAPLTSDVNVNGSSVTGDLIGSALFEGDTIFQGTYRADITGLVSTGMNTLILDGLATIRNDGASVIVIYDDGSAASVDIRDGHDYVYGLSPEPDPAKQVTVPQTFSFPADIVDRTAELVLIGGLAEAIHPDDAIIITINGTVTVIMGAFDSSDGNEWDTETFEVDIPAGVTEVTVEIEAIEDSIAWAVAALSIPEAPFCGDGIIDIDLNETCDPPGSVPDPNFPNNECRDTCTYCGDGVQNNGEECDFNDPNAPDNCGTDCMLQPICGDGNVDPGEYCDPPGSVPDPNFPNNECRDTCTYCGDGEQNNGEECDFNDPNAPPDCRTDCTLPECGDGIVDPGEYCDPPGSVPDPNFPNNECRDTCTYCGDGEQNNGEECDFNDPNAPANCGTDCMLQIGGEGCTPGYWKQSQHFGSWMGYSPNQLFSSVFEDAFPGKTLLQVLNKEVDSPNDLRQLGFHTVAALLSASSSDVSYDRTVNQVIMMFNNVYPGGNYESVKDIFEGFNEQGCPLGRAE